ncbi:hypothetical protein BDQ17DRAFT_1341985 [Cyathus striatus]|nr:hypothetical protein BDQ17DRAFT_1341985 [Cyathus striatus]
MVSIPAPLASLFSHFPLHTYPPIYPPTKVPVKVPTLWISPPFSSQVPLSSDVECLKWQAYLALRGISQTKVRSNIAPEGAIDGRLPNLLVPLADGLEPTEIKNDKSSNGEGILLPAREIPAWVDKTLGLDSLADPLEGYKDEQARDESRAWVTLLEGVVHAALILSLPRPTFFDTITSVSTSDPTDRLQTILSPPPIPLSGLFSLIRIPGARVNVDNVMSQYAEAIGSLSERLGTDEWFLGSNAPTPLDALAFAYLYCLLNSSKNSIRIEVSKRANLAEWEQRVRDLVGVAFIA